MKQVTETIWMPYPKYKPEKTGYYDITSTVYGKREALWTGDLFAKYDDVIAFAELPSPYDPSAKQVNFATAMLWMREDSECIMKYMFDGFAIAVCRIHDGHLQSFDNHDGWQNMEFHIKLMSSLWERVE